METVGLKVELQGAAKFITDSDKVAAGFTKIKTAAGEVSGGFTSFNSAMSGFATKVTDASKATGILNESQVKAALSASDLKNKTGDASGGMAEMDRMAYTLEQKMKAYDQGVKDAKTSTGGFTTNISTAATGMGTFATQAGTASTKTSEFAGAGDKIKTAFGNVAGFIGDAAGKLKDFAGDAAGKAISSLGDLGSAALDAGGKIVGVGINFIETGVKMGVDFAKSSVGVAADFESAMLTIQATSDSSAADMQKLNDAAIALGVQFPVSTTDVANGFGELTKAGFTANEVLAAGNGLITLGVAGNLDNAKSAEVLAGTIRGFGLAASDSNKVVDILATTANASSVDITDLGQTFKYAAPAAKALGFSLEDVSIASGILGNNMIKGSSAGTGLATIFSRLAAPPKDAAAAIETLGLKIAGTDGKVRPLRDIIGDLRAKFQGLSQVEQLDLAKKLAGQDAAKSLLSIISASTDDWNGMTKAIDGSAGSAEKMASIMSSGTKGALDNLGGSVEALQIKLGQQLGPAVNWVAGQFSGFVNGIGSFVGTGSMAELNKWFGQLGTTVLPALGAAFTGIMSWIATNGPAIMAQVMAWGIAFVNWIAPYIPIMLGEAGKIIVSLGNWVLSQVPVIVNQLLIWGQAFINWIAPQIPGILAGLGQIIVNIGTWIGQQLPVIGAQLLVWGQAFINWIGPQIGPMLGKLGDLAVAAIGWLGEQAGKLAEQLVVWGEQFLKWIGPKIPGMLAELGKLITSGLNWVQQQVGPLLQKLGEWGVQFINWVGPKIPGMMAELGKLAGQLIGWIFSQIPVIVGKLAEWGLAFLTWIATEVLPKLPGLLANIVTGIIQFVIAAVPEIVAGIQHWVTGMMDKFGELVSTLPAKIGEIATASLAAFATFGLDVIKWAGELPGKVIDAIKGFPGALFDAGKAAIQGLINGFGSLHIPTPHINVSWSSVGVGPLSVPIPNFDVKWYATGGIFSGPTLAGIGEAGPEAVLPLAKIVPLFADALRSVSKDSQSQMIRPPMSPNQMSYQYSNSRTSNVTNNMPIYTNQSPAALQQGLNILSVMA